MTKLRRLFVYILLIVLLVSCRTGVDTPASEPFQPIQKKTITTIPPTSTPEQVVETPTNSPTNTLAPTTTTPPPTFTLEPFLPSGLPQIGKENVDQLQVIAGLPVSEIYALAFSQSGDKLVTLSEHWQDRTNYLQVWDLIAGEQVLSLDDLESPWNPYFSPDENFLFIPFPNQAVEVYDLNQQKLAGTLDIGADWSVFSPDGNTIAVGDYLGTPDESTIRLIDLGTEQDLFTLTHSGMVMYLKFSLDGRLLIAGFQGPNHFRDLVWDISTQDLLADFIDYNYNLTFAPKSDLVATVKDEKIHIYSTDEWVLNYSYRFEDPYSNVKPRDFSRSGDILAVEDRYNIVFLDTKTGEKLIALPDECNIRFSPKGTALLTWCYQGDIKIWGVTP